MQSNKPLKVWVENKLYIRESFSQESKLQTSSSMAAPVRFSALRSFVAQLFFSRWGSSRFPALEYKTFSFTLLGGLIVYFFSWEVNVDFSYLGFLSIVFFSNVDIITNSLRVPRLSHNHRKHALRNDWQAESPASCLSYPGSGQWARCQAGEDQDQWNWHIRSSVTNVDSNDLSGFQRISQAGPSLPLIILNQGKSSTTQEIPTLIQSNIYNCHRLIGHGEPVQVSVSSMHI